MTFKIIPYLNHTPIIAESAYIANGCIIAGAVEVGSQSSIWFNSVVRGDVAPIKIGNNTNIQDGSIIHTSRFNGPVNIGDNITIGHMALIHACTIENNAFIGMRTCLMDNVIVEEFGFVAAGALITPGKVIKSKELWAGVPAKFIRLITEEEVEFMLQNMQNYVNLAKEYKK